MSHRNSAPEDRPSAAAGNEGADAADPLPEKIFIRTFHKTGHSLIGNVLQQAARRLGLKLWLMHNQIEEPDALGCLLSLSFAVR